MSRPTAICAALMVIGVLAATAGAQDPPRKQAVVQVTIRVLPFAEVTMDVGQVTVTLPAGATTAPPVTVGGTIRSNVGTTIYTRVTPPEGAQGDWVAEPEVRSLATGGTYHLSELLRITVYDLPIGFGGSTHTIGINGQSVGSVNEITKPGTGTATVTVIPD